MGKHLRVSGNRLRGDEPGNALCAPGAALYDSRHHPRLLEHAPAADTVRVSLVGDWRFRRWSPLAGVLDRAATDGARLTARARCITLSMPWIPNIATKAPGETCAHY